MTRKDYILIAKAMNRARPQSAAKDDKDRSEKEEAEVLQWVWDCLELADALQEENPRFDRDRFIAACKGDSK